MPANKSGYMSIGICCHNFGPIILPRIFVVARGGFSSHPGHRMRKHRAPRPWRVRGVEQWCHNVGDSLLRGYLGIVHYESSPPRKGSPHPPPQSAHLSTPSLEGRSSVLLVSHKDNLIYFCHSFTALLESISSNKITQMLGSYSIPK